MKGKGLDAKIVVAHQSAPVDEKSRNPRSAGAVASVSKAGRSRVARSAGAAASASTAGESANARSTTRYAITTSPLSGVPPMNRHSSAVV
eukprot:CAMPEP_0172173532 /NCGR_PEP_ID=MMETSP1050-20130122/13119_1 /TAXON_ID=233186 /ORGANISM="Cryptomonas curvata, Strain CCAP979/52" /LENGTH=89 /DNA_ID=CAMNT_0012845323 /DNA_START=208 /DNA_END=477 /DNA_ORIENTATION=-